MSGNTSRRKGAAAELELAKAIHDHLGVRLQRRLEQVRSAGWDLELHPDEDGPVAEQIGRYAIECKRAVSATPVVVAGWWRQCAAQAAAAYRIPCLAYRLDRQDWQFLVPIRELNRDLPMHQTDTTDYCCTLTLPGWCALVREGA